MRRRRDREVSNTNTQGAEKVLTFKSVDYIVISLSLNTVSIEKQEEAMREKEWTLK